MRNVLITTITSAFFVMSGTNAYAAASDLDKCILDITMQCTADNDFWGCYDTGVELCENQHSSQLDPGTINQIKKKNLRRAQKTFKKLPTKN